MRTERRRQIVQRLIDAGPHLTGLYGEHSTSQPASAYTDAGRFEHEIETLFRRGTSFFALSGACPSPGDYITGVVGRVPVAVVRQDTGAPAGFVNACRHRGAQPCALGLAFPTTIWSSPTSVAGFFARASTSRCAPLRAWPRESLARGC